MVQCGAASVSPRKKSIFPRIKGLDSCKKWLKSWFYVKNRDPEVDCIGLPNEFQIGPPVEWRNWEYNPRDEEEEVNLIHEILIQLMNEGMTGDDFLRTFVGRRINPLQDRTHKMCVMSDRHDSNRMTTFELSKEEVYRRVKAIARTSMENGEWQ